MTTLDLTPLILGGIVGLIALFFKHKYEKADAQVVEAKTEIADASLAAKQADDETKIKEIDKGIQEMKDEREKMRNQYLNDQQRADSWNKPKQ